MPVTTVAAAVVVVVVPAVGAGGIPHRHAVKVVLMANQLCGRRVSTAQEGQHTAGVMKFAEVGAQYAACAHVLASHTCRIAHASIMKTSPPLLLSRLQ